MTANKSVVAIIPARGNSKRIPDKNLLEINGLSLVQRAIECTVGIKSLDKVIASSEDARVLEQCEAYDHVDCHVRPGYLSNDTTFTSDVVIHIIEQYKLYDCWLLLLQPNSPFRTKSDLSKFMEFISSSEAFFTSAVSINELRSTHPDKVQIIKDGFVYSYLGKNSSVPSQSLPTVYELNGCFYLTDINYFLNKKRFISEKCLPFIMDKTKSLNLDTKEDLILMEHYLSSGILNLTID